MVHVDFEELNVFCAEQQTAIEDSIFLSNQADYEDVVPNLKEAERQIDAAQKKAKCINEIQQFLGIPLSSTEQVECVSSAVAMRLELWIGKKEFDQETDGIYSQNFLEVDLAHVDELVAQNSKTVSRLERNLPENDRLPRFHTRVEQIKKLLPVMTSLQNPMLKHRHWEKIDDIVGRPLSEKTFSLEDLVDMGILRWIDCLSSIAAEASQEASLEQTLQKIIEKWSETEFTLLNYKESKDIYILTAVDDITAQLDDSLLTMNTISSSRSCC